MILAFAMFLGFGGQIIWVDPWIGFVGLFVRGSIPGFFDVLDGLHVFIALDLISLIRVGQQVISAGRTALPLQLAYTGNRRRMWLARSAQAPKPFDTFVFGVRDLHFSIGTLPRCARRSVARHPAFGKIGSCSHHS